MAKKPENQFITSVHKHVPPSQLYRMKNHNAYVGGVPDVYYSGSPGPSGSSNDLWVEYKYIPVTTPRADVVPDLSRQQFDWIKGRRSEGRSCWVIVGSKNGGVIFTDLDEMQNGITAFEYLDRLVDRKTLMKTIHLYCTGEETDGRI